MTEEPRAPSQTEGETTDGTGTKQSFEANPAVQGWLREQQRSVGEDLRESAFDPKFLARHHERAWILSSLSGFHAQGLITDVVGVVKPGKEATVYCCEANARVTGTSLLAAKVYRPRMFRSLKNDAVYRDNREVARDRRQRRAMKKKTRKGRGFQAQEWIRYEYETHCLLYDAGAHVPRPFDCQGNATLMEFIGDGDGAAPLLKDVQLDPSEAAPLFEALVEQVELFLACDRVHGDLSAYNILYWEGECIVIDLAQAADPRRGLAVYELLLRDVQRLIDYFGGYGIDVRATDLAESMWHRYMRGAL